MLSRCSLKERNYNKMVWILTSVLISLSCPFVYAVSLFNPILIYPFSTDLLSFCYIHWLWPWRKQDSWHQEVNWGLSTEPLQVWGERSLPLAAQGPGKVRLPFLWSRPPNVQAGRWGDGSLGSGHLKSTFELSWLAAAFPRCVPLPLKLRCLDQRSAHRQGQPGGRLCRVAAQGLSHVFWVIRGWRSFLLPFSCQ